MLLYIKYDKCMVKEILKLKEKFENVDMLNTSYQ